MFSGGTETEYWSEMYIDDSMYLLGVAAGVIKKFDISVLVYRINVDFWRDILYFLHYPTIKSAT